MGGSETDGLRLEITTRPHARLVGEFYHEYARAFVLPDERESLAGFRVCLGLNGERGEALRKRFGSSVEHIGVLRDASGTIAAGMNFICFPMPALGPGLAQVMTVHSIYVFVTSDWRRRGLLRRIYATMEGVARSAGAAHGLAKDAALVFIGEQNDPFRMTPAAFARDTGASGLDQFDRLAIWGRLGARVLTYPYVQPALSARSAPDTTLFLRVLFRDEGGAGEAPRPLDARILREHLRRFFAITVLKGRADPDKLPEVAAQEKLLDGLIATGRPVLAHRMPGAATLRTWKARAAKVLRERPGEDEQTIGALLGIPSVPESLTAAVRA
jgi:GNAT superfamily N-acetyltransferase